MTQTVTWPFKYCPNCGTREMQFADLRKYTCPICGLSYFHNVATGAGVLLMVQNRLLLLKRGKNPGKGLYTIPGGFVDPGESAEEAVIRECREETGLKLEKSTLKYLTSRQNLYKYKNIPYVTCDIFFTAELNQAKPVIDGKETTKAVFAALNKIDPAILAFPSTRHALDMLIGYYREHSETYGS